MGEGAGSTVAVVDWQVYPCLVKQLIPASSRGNNFDAIRLAMALLVVWSHSFALHLGSEQTEWISVLMRGCYNAGNLAVMAFFIISGFLITQSWERSRSAASYMSKRIRRIYPGFLVAISICAFIVAPLFGGKFPNPAVIYGYGLFLRDKIPQAFPHHEHAHAVNGSLWSIPFEFWCYVGVAVAGTLLLKRPRLLIALCALLMLGRLVQEATGKMPGLGPINTIFGWPYLWTKIGPSFVLGMIAYAYRDYLPRRPQILVGFILAAWIACWMSHYLADWLVAPALAYSVFYVAFSEKIRLYRAAKYGDFSYGCYLYAFPIQQILQATLRLTLPEFIAFSAALSLVAGALSWHLVEKHFKGHKSREPKSTVIGRADELYPPLSAQSAPALSIEP